MMNKMLNGKKILVKKMERNDLKGLGVSKNVLDAYSDSGVDVYQHAEQKDRFFISLAGEMWEEDIDGVEFYLLGVSEIMEVKE